MVWKPVPTFTIDDGFIGNKKHNVYPHNTRVKLISIEDEALQGRSHPPQKWQIGEEFTLGEPVQALKFGKNRIIIYTAWYSRKGRFYELADTEFEVIEKYRG